MGFLLPLLLSFLLPLGSLAPLRGFKLFLLCLLGVGLFLPLLGLVITSFPPLIIFPFLSWITFGLYSHMA